MCALFSLADYFLKVGENIGMRSDSDRYYYNLFLKSSQIRCRMEITSLVSGAGIYRFDWLPNVFR